MWWNWTHVRIFEADLCWQHCQWILFNPVLLYTPLYHLIPSSMSERWFPFMRLHCATCCARLISDQYSSSFWDTEGGCHGREQKAGVQRSTGKWERLKRHSERICLCRLHTHYDLEGHIRSLSPYTKLLLIIDTALWLFCFVFPSPQQCPSRRLPSLPVPLFTTTILS